MPPGIAAIKKRTDAEIVLPLVREGVVTRYAAIPEYEGESVVPVAIDIVASDPGELSVRIVIWGKALAEAAEA